MIFYRKITIILLLISAFGCSKQFSNSSKDEIELESNSNTERIMFVSFNAKLNQNSQKTEIQLIEKNIVGGNLKPQLEKTFLNSISIQVYENNKFKNTIILEHPLYKTVEFEKEGTFQKKELKLEEADFFFRLQLNSNKTELKIFEKLYQKPETLLQTIQL